MERGEITPQMAITFGKLLYYSIEQCFYAVAVAINVLNKMSYLRFFFLVKMPVTTDIARMGSWILILVGAIHVYL